MRSGLFPRNGGSLGEESSLSVVATIEPNSTAKAIQSQGFSARRRDRHGRGLRGNILPKEMPGALSPSQRFDDFVMDSAQRLSELWGKSIEQVQFAVQEIPDGLEELVIQSQRPPLALYEASTKSSSARITLYRKPLESLCRESDELRESIHEVIIEQAAMHLNVSTEMVDPVYHRTRKL